MTAIYDTPAELRKRDELINDDRSPPIAEDGFEMLDTDDLNSHLTGLYHLKQLLDWSDYPGRYISITDALTLYSEYFYIIESSNLCSYEIDALIKFHTLTIYNKVPCKINDLAFRCSLNCAIFKNQFKRKR